MLGNIAKKIFGSSNDRRLKTYRPKVAAIAAIEPELVKLTDEQLAHRTVEFREQLAAGTKLDDLIVPAFATVREAAKRVLGQRHFDVQMIGGMVLNERGIAEMRTGEGKTLVATLAVYLNALEGKGVHVVTVNDYLARRDAEWMGRVYKFLGLSVGIIVHGLDDEERAASYQADITYGTNNEFGFDYLRDNMKFELHHMVQRGHNFAVVDEVDSILVDEARTPAHHLRPVRRQVRALQRRRQGDPAPRAHRLRARREAAHLAPHRGRQREDGGAAHRDGRADRGLALRRLERDHRPPRQPGAQGAQAVTSATRTTSSATTRSS